MGVGYGTAGKRILIPSPPVLAFAGGFARNGWLVLGAERLENEWEAPLGPGCKDDARAYVGKLALLGELMRRNGGGNSK